MKVLIINSVCGIGSTGRICTDLAAEFEEQGHEVKIAYGRYEAPKQFQKYAVRIGGKIDTKLHGLKTRIFDAHGFGSKIATKKFLKWADNYNPDLLWLHNIHGYYINVEMLFDWIKSRPNMKVNWTLHDCWAFTGHCTYFSFVGCNKWEYGCTKCAQKGKYPQSLFRDNCENNYKRKKRAFTNAENMTLITPSKWLANLVSQSFLKEYPIEIHYNKINTDVFKPTPSDFREKNGLNNKKIVLGVANGWGERKGYKDFLKLADMLDEDYVIVLVGVAKKQLKQLPKNIIGIEHTNSTKELAEIYTAADVFVNLTYEDNFPTVNLESQACGTPCITYATGGSVESVPEENIVGQGDLRELIKTIKIVLNA